jgi:tRNA modification GTPase
LDASESLTSADETYLREFGDKKRILVLNKSDLPRRLDLPRGRREEAEAPGSSEDIRLLTSPATVEASCLTGAGIEALKDAIKQMVWSGEIKAEMLQVAINSRHQEALTRARTATLRTVEALRADQPLDLVALDLRIAANAVGEIVGKTTTEDLLDMIFSQFCIGK